MSHQVRFGGYFGREEEEEQTQQFHDESWNVRRFGEFRAEGLQLVPMTVSVPEADVLGAEAGGIVSLITEGYGVVVDGLSTIKDEKFQKGLLSVDKVMRPKKHKREAAARADIAKKRKAQRKQKKAQRQARKDARKARQEAKKRGVPPQRPEAPASRAQALQPVPAPRAPSQRMARITVTYGDVAALELSSGMLLSEALKVVGARQFSIGAANSDGWPRVINVSDLVDFLDVTDGWTIDGISGDIWVRMCQPPAKRIGGITPNIGTMPLSEAEAMLEGLVERDRVQLRDGARPISEGIESGAIRYNRADPGERWLTIRELWNRGSGDCEDLAAAIAAEYRERGQKARVKVQAGNSTTAHAVVEMGDGTIHDPSKWAGMGTPDEVQN